MQIAIKESMMMIFIFRIETLLIVKVMIEIDVHENAFTLTEFLARSTSLYTHSLLRNSKHLIFCCAKIMLWIEIAFLFHI